VTQSDESGAIKPDREVLGEQLDASDIHRLLAWYFAQEHTPRRTSREAA
jgi:hypothetical protein